MSLAGYGRGVNWVSHKRESSLTTLPTAASSPPSSRTSFSFTNPSAFPASDPPHLEPDRTESAAQNAEEHNSNNNDLGLKGLYGIRTIAMRRESSHSVTSSISNSSNRTKTSSPELSTHSDFGDEDKKDRARTPSDPKGKEVVVEEEESAASSTSSNTASATDAVESTPEPVVDDAALGDGGTPVSRSTPLPALYPESSDSAALLAPTSSALTSPQARSLGSAVDDTCISPPESPSQTQQRALSRRASALQVLHQRRRMASAPFGRTVSPMSPDPSFSTASAFPTPSHSPKNAQPTPLPFYGRSGRRARSRHPTRSNSELLPLQSQAPAPLSAIPSSMSPSSSRARLPMSASLSDLVPMRMQHLNPDADLQLLTPREIVMTPTTEEWKAYGGKVGSSKLTLRHDPDSLEQHTSSHEPLSSNSSLTSDDSDDEDDYFSHTPRRTRGEALLHDRARGLEPPPLPKTTVQPPSPNGGAVETSPSQRPPTKPTYSGLPAAGLANMDVHVLNRTASENLAAAKGPVSLKDTGPIDPKRYSAVTGLRDINSFSIQSEAGAGAYGSVVKAKEIATGIEVIIKCVVKQRILADCWKKHRILGPIPVEIHVLDQLRRIPYSPILPLSPLPKQQTQRPSTGHPNLCSLLDFWEDNENYYLCMPVFGLGQDLFDHVDEYPDGLPLSQLNSILSQIAAGVAFLHMNGMVHRDIKDENVILDGRGNAALIDFGSAAYYKDHQLFDTFSGTLDFAAPEVLRGERYDATKTDVWAFGVLAYVLICGECPFWHSDEAVDGLKPGTRASAALDEKLRLQPDLKEAIDLVRRCVEVEAVERPPAQEICHHAFFAPGGWTGKLGWKKDVQENNKIHNSA